MQYQLQIKYSKIICESGCLPDPDRGICSGKEVGACILSAAQSLIIYIFSLSMVKKLGAKPTIPNLRIQCRTAILARVWMSVWPHSRFWTSLRAMFLPLVNAFTVRQVQCSLQCPGSSRIACVRQCPPGAGRTSTSVQRSPSDAGSA